MVNIADKNIIRSVSGNILFLSNFSGATFTFIADRELIIGLSKRGFNMFTVAYQKRPELDLMEDSGVTVIYAKSGSTGVINIDELRLLIGDKSIDIVHVTYSKALKNVLKAIKGLNVKLVTFYGSFGLHWHDPSAWFSYLHPRIDKIICVSDAVEKHVKKQLPPRRKERTIRIYRGYNISWFDGIEPINRSELGVALNDFLICSIAIVRKIKGLEFLIDAANYIPPELPVKIMLVGKGTDSEMIRKRVKRTKRPDIFILVGHASISPAYTAACDIYLQPSISEGLGRAIIEAMCLGKPVIATNGGGLVELFDKGDANIVPHSNAKAIADKITECYHNRGKLGETGTRAKERIAKYFNLTSSIEMTETVYFDLIKEKTLKNCFINTKKC
jgi:glycosyltransferase involved in cell wall biosynthesis